MTRRLAVIGLVAAGLAGCWHASPLGHDAGVGGDADADADVDADADTDADADPGCPLNSGWPCTCHQADLANSKCGNGGLCAYIQGLGDGTTGYCMRKCSVDGDCGNSYGEGFCGVWDGGDQFYCVIYCTDPDQCPPSQSCQYVEGGSICHP